MRTLLWSLSVVAAMTMFAAGAQACPAHASHQTVMTDAPTVPQKPVSDKTGG